MRSLFLTLALIAGLIAPAHAGDDKPVDTSDLNPVELYLFKLAMKAAPPSHAWKPPSGPHSKETERERTLRYKRIAHDLYVVTFDERNKPIHGFSRLHTAGFLMGMMVGESGLAPDADLGPCYRGGKYRSRCDGGRAVGLLQVWIHKSNQKRYWTNRKRLLWRGLRGIRGSFGSCHKNPIEERLAAYGAGTCESKAGKRVSRKRYKLIQGVMSYARPPKNAKKYVIAAPKKSGSGKKKVAAKD